MLSEIFSMFVQVDSSRANARGGLGIGLTLVKSVVEMHGGDVRAHSDGVGAGSTFVVRLPLFAEMNAGESLAAGERR
jgi:signal transduction histidine kinase